MNVLAISGSLHPDSSNSVLLAAACEASPDGTDIVVWSDLELVPPFRPETRNGDAAPPVLDLRRRVATADLVVVATPEYAGGMPGTLKNAFDWLVGSGEFDHTSVLVVSAAPAEERGRLARRGVVETLEMQGARVVDSFTVATHRSNRAESLDAAAERLVAAIGAATRWAR